MITGNLKKNGNTAYTKINNSLPDDNGNFIINAETVGLESFDGLTPQTLPVSTAIQEELDSKQDSLVSGTNIKTINNQSILGEGNINTITKEDTDKLYVEKEILETTTYTNLFDKDSPDLIIGKYTPTNTTSESFADYAQYAVSNFIPAVKGDIIWSSYIAWETAAFYDIDKNRIGGLRQPYAHTTPDKFTVGERTLASDQLIFFTGKTADDIAFVRVNIKFEEVNPGELPAPTPLDEAMIMKNTELPNVYVPYGTPLVVSGKEVAPKLTILASNIEDASIPLSKLEEIPSTEKNIFKGKKILITGDSIVEYANGFVSMIRDWTDFETVYNDGKSGTGIASPYGSNVGIIDRCQNWETTYGDFDYIMISGNMNDSKTTSFLLGEFDDGAEPIDSQYAALKTLFEKLITLYPLKQIVFVISTPRRNSYANDVYKDSVAYNPNLATTFSYGITSWFEPYCTAIKEVCAHYGIPVLDLYHESGLRPWDDTFNNTLFVSSDGTHPNVEGHKILANKIIPFLEREVGSNE